MSTRHLWRAIDRLQAIADGNGNDDLWNLAVAAREELSNAEDALRPFARYAEKRAAKPLRGLDDVIHAIHAGEDGAEIRLSHCNAARDALEDES